MPARCAINFHPAQRQAILNTVVAHEVLGSATLRSLYEIVVPEALAVDDRLIEVTRLRFFHPNYCIGAVAVPDAARVLQALLIWQLLNKNAVLRQGRDDPRFTHNFLLATPDSSIENRWREILFGRADNGVRDFATADLATCIDLLVPTKYREYVIDFWRDQLRDANERAKKGRTTGLIAVIAQRHFSGGDAAPSLPLHALSPRSVNTLEFFAGLPDLMMFADGINSVDEEQPHERIDEKDWQVNLARLAENKGRRFISMDFSAAASGRWSCDGAIGARYFPHVIGDLDGLENNPAHFDRH